MNDENERKCALCGSPDFILANWPPKPCEHLSSLATAQAQFEQITDVSIAVKILSMSHEYGSPLPDAVFSKDGRRIL